MSWRCANFGARFICPNAPNTWKRTDAKFLSCTCIGAWCARELDRRLLVFFLVPWECLLPLVPVCELRLKCYGIYGAAPERACTLRDESSKWAILIEFFFKWYINDLTWIPMILTISVYANAIASSIRFNSNKLICFNSLLK